MSDQPTVINLLVTGKFLEQSPHTFENVVVISTFVGDMNTKPSTVLQKVVIFLLDDFSASICDFGAKV